MFKRLMSLMLAFVMVLSVCPVSVWAEETVESTEEVVVESIPETADSETTEEETTPATTTEEAIPETMVEEILNEEVTEAAALATADGVAVNETNFPDNAFRTYVSENVDKNADDVLSQEERERVRQIVVSEAGIQSLAGIAFFPNLTYLDCYSNQLTSLDVSKNTALTDLQCGINDLTSLDVSKNTALESLYCYQNQLKSLDVSKNTALTVLNCGLNELTSLDVSKNTALRSLWCYGNQLTSLDVSHNDALEEFGAEDQYYQIESPNSRLLFADLPGSFDSTKILSSNVSGDCQYDETGLDFSGEARWRYTYDCGNGRSMNCILVLSLTGTLPGETTITAPYAENVTFTPGGEVVYSFTPAESGNYVFYEDVFAMPMMYVYQGEQILTSGQSRVEFAAVAGTTYTLKAQDFAGDGYQGAAIPLKLEAAVALEEITFMQGSDFTGAVGTNYVLIPVYSPANAHVEGDPVWAVDDETVAAISNPAGQAYANVELLAPGTATVTAACGDVVGSATFTVQAPAGSEENPISIWDVEAPFSAEVGADETLYFSGRIFDMTMTAENAAGAVLTLNGTSYEADENGKLEVYFPAAAGMGRPMPVTFTLTNNSDADAVYTLNFAMPVGTYNNPAELVLGDNTATVAADNMDGYNYVWTAEEDGTLTIEMTCENWQYVYDYSTYDSAMGDAAVLNIDVKAGDEIYFSVNGFNPDDMWALPGGTITFYASFLSAPGTEGNPISIWDVEAPFDAEVGAGKTVYYTGRIHDMTLTAENAAGAVLTLNGTSYEADENGKLEVYFPAAAGMGRPMPVVFALTNKTNADAVYTLKFIPPVGTYNNPAELVLGENTATVAADNMDGYNYVWTAEESGALTIEMTCENWQYVYDYSTYDSAMGDAAVLNIDVKAGDMVYFSVNGFNPDDVWALPGGTITFKASFAGFTAPVISSDTDDASGKPVISWDAVPGAVKYKVYRATSKTGKYSLKKTTDALSYTDTSAKAGTTYYYKVKAVDANGDSSKYSNYKSVTCDLAQPEIKLSNVSSSGKIKVSWGKVSGAKKYEVRRSTDGEKWTLVKTTTSTSYTNTSAKAGQTYFYKVRAIASKSSANSAYSLVESLICKLARPVVDISGDSATGKIELDWDDISGAKEYIIFRETAEDGAFDTELARVADDEFTDDTAVAGTKYFYRVVAAHEDENANSAKSLVDERTCDLARPVISLTNRASDGKITVSWKAVEGAKEYKVYRATSKSGTYKLMKTYEAGEEEYSYTNTSVTAGKTYYYKVRAIHENSAANSAYSSIKSRTADLAQPQVTITETKSGSAKLSWKKVSGAKEYKVYRSTDGEDWDLMKTTTSTSYTNTSVKDNTVYFYRVRAIHKSSSAHSAYSDVLQFARLGSEANPVVIENVEAAFTAEIEAGKTVCFSGSIFEMTLTAENAAGAVLTLNGVEYSADENGKLVVDFPAAAGMGRPTPVTFSITNGTDKDAEYVLTFAPTVGTYNNPAELVLGENTATVAADNWNGYNYVWTAEENGTLTIEMACENWQYVYDYMTYDSAMGDAAVLNIDVKAGDIVYFSVNGFNPDDVWALPGGTITFYASFQAPVGTEANPITVWGAEEPVIADVGAGETVYISGRVQGMTMTAENAAGAVLTLDGVEYAADESGKLEVTFPAAGGMGRPMPVTFTLTNNSDADAVYTLNFALPVGTMDNPDEIVLGENTATVAADNWDGYNYIWTAEESGTLTIEMTCENWQYVYDYSPYDSAMGDAAVLNIDVKAGDIVYFSVNGFDPAEPYALPGGTITFTASFEEEFQPGENELPIA